MDELLVTMIIGELILLHLLHSIIVSIGLCFILVLCFTGPYMLELVRRLRILCEMCHRHPSSILRTAYRACRRKYLRLSHPSSRAPCRQQAPTNSLTPRSALGHSVFELTPDHFTDMAFDCFSVTRK
jgi:hypothetical protein